MNLSYSSLAAALAFFAAIVADPARAQDDIRVRIAKSYGLPAWSQVQQLRYTFNVDRGKDRIKRSWLWDVKNNSVTFEGAGKDGQPVKRSYVRSDVKAGSPEIVETDRMFLNDEYWLVFPFHLVWDSSAKIE